MRDSWISDRYNICVISTVKMPQKDIKSTPVQCTAWLDIGTRDYTTKGNAQPSFYFIPNWREIKKTEAFLSSDPHTQDITKIACQNTDYRIKWVYKWVFINILKSRKCAQESTYKVCWEN